MIYGILNCKIADLKGWNIGTLHKIISFGNKRMYAIEYL